jgi:protein gp37
MAWRLANNPLTPHYKGMATAKDWTGKFNYSSSELGKLLHWRSPRAVFVCSMSDLFFLYGVARSYFWLVMSQIQGNPQHLYILLTKRAETMEKLAGKWYARPNIWLGVTVENQKAADERIPHLLGCKAAVRFVSVEPMLERVDLSKYLDRLDWVIGGAETGAGARPIRTNWMIDLRDQCKEAGTPFFFKRWGRVLSGPIGEYMPREFPKRSEK